MGILYIVATPIGNMEDITIRAIKTLFSVDYIACEDTRNTGQLLASLKTPRGWQAERSEAMTPPMVDRSPQLISYYDEVEFKRIPEIIGLLEQDKNVALVSDSGTPLISDPGFKLVRECIKRGIKVTSIPGATSFVTALTSSGLPPDQFLFLGYLPPNKNRRVKLLLQLKASLWDLQEVLLQRAIHPTVIFFESPHRISESLEDIKEVFGDIEIVIARELTKIHEEIWRGSLSAFKLSDKLVKGEMVILFNIPQA